MGLPATLTAYLEGDDAHANPVTVNVTWDCADYASSAASYTFTAALAADSAAQYQLASGVVMPTATLTLVDRAVIASFAALSRTSYEQSTKPATVAAAVTAMNLPATLTAYLEGDDAHANPVTVNVTWNCANYTSNAASYTFTAALAADSAAQYQLASGVAMPTVTLKITGGEKTITASLKSGVSLNKTYDKSRNVYTDGGKDKTLLNSNDITLSGVQSGDTVRISKLESAFDNSSAGTRTVTIRITLTPGNTNVYTYNTTCTITQSATISKKDLVVTPRAGQTKVYGTSNPSSYKGSVSGLMTGDAVSGKLGRETGENVGTYKYNAGTLKAGVKDSAGTFVETQNYNIVVRDEVFTITAKSITPSSPASSSDVTMSPATISNQRYTGGNIEPTFTLQNGTTTLTKGRDYTVSYSNNRNPGQATITIQGIGNYTGTRTVNFTIIRVSGGSSGSYSYGGSSGGSSGSSSSSPDSEGDDYEDETTENGAEDEEAEDVEDAFDAEEDFEETIGELMLNDEPHGTILFSDLGDPRPFTQEDEQIDEFTRRLLITAEPMVDVATGETVTLPDDDTRSQYEALHLRLTPQLAETLALEGYTEIVYELENARLLIPLDELTEEIDLTDYAQDYETAYVEEDPEAEPTEAPEEIDEDGEDGIVEEAGTLEITEPVAVVKMYDICVTQVNVENMTERENEALLDRNVLAPLYRVAMIAESDDEIEASNRVDDVNATPVDTLNEAQPMRYSVLDVMSALEMQVTPLKEIDMENDPVSAALLFVSDAEETEAAEDEAAEDEVFEETDEEADAEADVILDEEADADEDALVVLTDIELEDVDGTLCAVFTPTRSGMYTIVEVEEEAEEDEAWEEVGEEEEAEAEEEPEEETSAVLEPSLDPLPQYAYWRRSSEANQYWLVNTETRTVEYYNSKDDTYMVGHYTGSLVEGLEVNYEAEGILGRIRLKFPESYKFALNNDSGADLLMEQTDVENVESIIAEHR